ncbi:PIG-L family deacetylase [Candidatus Curtissbacteria bacterium]|nr:PIG-L family deacetylase [Candidatus Curtissbacteria bacterium]
MTLLKNPKTLVAVFAHPDDEAFGPAGTLVKLAKKNDIYILCATRGEAGGDHQELAKIREKELLKSAAILGVREVYFLGFADGTLSNSIYHKLAEKIEEKIKILQPDTLLTFEPRGISGHIDHIVVSLVTTYVFNKLSVVNKLLYYCISDQERKLIKDYFIYFPPGYKKSEIDEIVDINDVWPTKLAAMMAHKTQRSDAEKILKIIKKLPKEEYFLVLEKG